MLRTLSLRHVGKNAPCFVGNERVALSSPGRRLYQSTTTTTHRSLLTPARVSMQTSLATKKALAAFPTTTKRYFQSGAALRNGQGGFRMNPNQEQPEENALEKYASIKGLDLTAMAEKGKLVKGCLSDPVIGRDEEIRRTLEV
ncbi:hypothetical protein [Absidia glauca]|uniref:Uncharacterized protein n=1 Tax=Absidia glauca TaxID=4829 RepID=A0A163IWN0_ABSGL|nr:hypothetical protein [Absidia glauca]